MRALANSRGHCGISRTVSRRGNLPQIGGWKPPPRKPRGGYAMLVVLVFLAVGLTVIGINQRHIATILRIEQARTETELFQEGPIHVSAEALVLLETGLPPANPYTCGVTVDTTVGHQSFEVTFTSSVAGEWAVSVEPTDDVGALDAMPSSFATN